MRRLTHSSLEHVTAGHGIITGCWNCSGTEREREVSANIHTCRKHCSARGFKHSLHHFLTVFLPVRTSSVTRLPTAHSLPASHTHTSCCVLCEWRRVCGRWEVYSRMNHQSSLRLTSRMVDWAQKFPSSRMCGISLMISFVLFPPSVQKCTKLNLCLTSAY